MNLYAHARRNRALQVSPPRYTYLPRDVGDGVSDLTGLLSREFARLAGTGKTLFIDDGDYLFSAQLPSITGFKVEMSPSARLIATAKAGLRIAITGAKSALVGGEIRNRAMRRYRIESISQPGGADTAVTINLLAADITEFGAHDFAAGDIHYNQNVPLTAGTWNGVPLTVASVTPTSITYEARTATIDTGATYPYDRLDGHGRAIYPVVYRSRTQASADALLLVSDATDVLVRETALRWAATNGIYTTRTLGFEYDRITATQTAADGLFVTDKSGRGRIVCPLVEETGDDMIAFVGYKSHGGRVHDITVVSPRIRNQWFHGRGVAWVGTENVRVFGLQAEDIYGAAIMMARDSSAATYGNTGAVCDGFAVKTAGNNGAVPTGWQANVLASIHLAGGSLNDADGNRRCVVSNGTVYNSRYRVLGGATTPQEVDIVDVRAVECNSNGAQLCLHNSIVERLSLDRVQSNAITLTEASTGVNVYRNTRISNVNRGTRLFIKSVSVASGTLTIVLEPGQSHTLDAASQVIVQWVSSAYASSSSEDAEVAKDYAINGAWTLATVTADAGGDILTVTGTGLADTAHARTRNPGQPHPHAYLSLASGAASSTDGIAIDTDTMTGKCRLENVRFGEQLWPMERTVDLSGSSSNQWRVSVSGVSCDTDDGFGGVGWPQAQHQYFSQGTTVSADSNQAIAVEYIRRRVYPRSGLTAGRSDTWPTAAQIVEALWDAHASLGIEVKVKNYSGQTLTLLTNTGLTLSGTMTVAANTTVTFQVAVTNATPGAAAVTITRIDAQSGLAA